MIVNTVTAEPKRRKVLVIIDMQYDFIDGSLANPDAQAIVAPICQLIKDGGFDEVILTRDTHDKDYLETTEGRNLAVVHCLKDTKGWIVHKDITDALIETGVKYAFIDKPTFGYTGWENYERGTIPSPWNYDQSLYNADITVVGTCTDICVVSNVLIMKAQLPDAQIVVIDNLCAGTSPEAHRAALQTMASCQVKVVHREYLEPHSVDSIKK